MYLLIAMLDFYIAFKQNANLRNMEEGGYFPLGAGAFGYLLIKTGRGIGTENCRLTNAFPPDDLTSVSDLSWFHFHVNHYITY